MSRASSIFTILVFLISTMAVAGAEESLVGYWPFDEGSGDTTADASGNGHDGQLIDGPTWVQGRFGSALDFGGNGSYVLVADNDALDLAEAVSVMGWFKLNEPIEGQRRLMSKNNSIFFLFDFSDPNSLDFLVKPGNDFAESTTAFEVGQWYHFAGTYDGDALRMYIDGVLEGETTGVPTIAPSDLDLWIGADDHNLPTTSFPGVLDDIRIYSVALAENDIRAVMENVTAVQGEDKLPITWGALKAAR